MWIFCDNSQYESRYEELLKSLLNEPVLPAPLIGENPFEVAKLHAAQTFFPGPEKYVSPASKGRVTFDYSNNNGKYCIGAGTFMFETCWSKASDRSIYLLNDPVSIATVALVNDRNDICSIDDARRYDGSSRARCPSTAQIAVLQNANGYFSAIKIVEIRDDTRGSEFDQITFDYVIQTNGSPSFVK